MASGACACRELDRFAALSTAEDDDGTGVDERQVDLQAGADRLRDVGKLTNRQVAATGLDVRDVRWADPETLSHLGQSFGARLG